MKLLVAATLFSAPACKGMTHSAAAASGELASLTSVTVVAWPRRNTSIGSIRSGLRPDCDMATASVPRVTSGAWYKVTSDIGSEVTS